MPLGDNQSTSVSCKETVTRVHIPDSPGWVGACPTSRLLDSSGTGARISGECCAGGHAASCTCHPSHESEGNQWPTMAGCWDPDNSHMRYRVISVTSRCPFWAVPWLCNLRSVKICPRDDDSLHFASGPQTGLNSEIKTSKSSLVKSTELSQSQLNTIPPSPAPLTFIYSTHILPELIDT